MAKFFDALTEKHRRFIERQPMFFVATAAAEGRINLSPKGMDTFRVLGPNQVAYLDLTGSGNETAAHLLACNRITVMFCSFGDNPLILRLYGRGRSVKPDSDDFSALAAGFPKLAGTRQIFVIDVDGVQTSCGKAVPRIGEMAERTDLVDAWGRMTPEEIADYRRKRNSVSIDGLHTGIDSNDETLDRP